MKQGFVKVGAATVDLRAGDISYNTERIKEQFLLADNSALNLLVLPELSLTGVSCEDLFFTDTLLTGAEEALYDLVAFSSTLYPVFVVGLPFRLNGRLYNAAAVISSGRLLGIVPKAQSDESEAFSAYEGENVEIVLGDTTVPFGASLVFASAQYRSFAFGVELGDNGMLPIPACLSSCLNGALIVANPTARPLYANEDDAYRAQLSSLSARLHCAYVSAAASPCESTADMVYADHHVIYENGTLLAEHLPLSDSHLLISEIDLQALLFERKLKYPTGDGKATYCYFDQEVKETSLTRRYLRDPFLPSARDKECERILLIQAYGLKKRFEHTHAATAVIGISGGLDSTLALLALVRCFDLMSKPRTDIHAITMPCFGTTSRTKNNAQTLCQALGVTLIEIPIADAVRQHFADIGHEESLHDVTFENSQARERTQVLMDYANRKNGLVIGTGDLSELALGWATYNGDHMSMYGVNASIPKTVIRTVVAYEAKRLGATIEKTLTDILLTPISPELLPHEDGKIAQKTEDLVGPYELHDFFLYHFLRYGASPTKIYRLARYAFDGEYEDKTILYWLKTFFRRFFTQQFKRSCMPDGAKVTRLSLSSHKDFYMPSDVSGAAFLREIDEL